MLIKSMVISKALWDAGDCPPPVAIRQAMRKQIMAAIYGHRAGVRSGAVALSLHVPGQSIDPAVIIPFRVITDFVRRLRQGFYHEHLLMELWPGDHEQGQPSSRHKSPFREVVREAKRIGWRATTHKKWVSRDGSEIELLNVSWSCLKTALWDSAVATALAKEARRRKELAGLELGVDMVALKNIFNSMGSASNEEKAKKQGAARVIQQGGVWTPARGRCMQDGPPRCTWCGVGVETLQHRWWECQAWNEVRMEAGMQVRQLHEGFQNFPAVWECGIPLQSLAAIPPPQGGIGVVEIPVTELPVKCWTDGACTEPRDPRVRRAGWGLWLAPGHAWNSSGPLLGQEQTAYRAELRAIVAALEKFAGEVNVASDNESAVNAAKLVMQDPGISTVTWPHNDLWMRLRNAVQHRPGRIQIRWVKGHRFEEGHHDNDAIGNHYADELADRGAKTHEVPQHVLQLLKSREEQLRSIMAMQVQILHAVMRKRGAPTLAGARPHRVRCRRRRRAALIQDGLQEPGPQVQGAQHEQGLR
jgi:ribonuclease HI